jgi:sugar phosphate isomerase/epimerase
MTLVVEMHADTLADTAQSALRLMREVDRDNFRLNFQVASVEDGVSPEQRLQETLPWIAHVHAQNYERVPAPGEALQRAPLASGAVDYRSLLARLKDFGYRGCVAVEFAYTEQSGREEALAEDAAFLRAACGDG